LGVGATKGKDKTIVKCRWIYKVKKDGLTKPRLVAKGFSQTHGIDYNETFAPAAKFKSIRVLALAAQEVMEIHQMDVVSAFRAGDLEEVYMEQPQEYLILGRNGEELVCKLKRPLHGLK
jgi:hypothetical protein